MYLNKLSTLMGEKRINISKMSKATGISRETISNIYNQRNTNTSFKTLVVICDYLKVPLHDLVDYIPEKEVI